jgi:hypothetical protein
MSNPQKKAVESHRRRQSEKGIIRMELNVPQKDREMLRSLAGVLRNGGIDADRLRLVMGSALKGEQMINFKCFLEMAPLELLDLERPQDSGEREIDW